VLAAALMLFTLSGLVRRLHRPARRVRRVPHRHRDAARRVRRSLALLEPFTLVFLLPVFFTYSGLNTQLTMVNTPRCCSSRSASSARPSSQSSSPAGLAARLSGQDNRSALGIGALMNARGLTELIILNIGLSAGIIGRRCFR
jgi:Kef-type K+ transport system membrane component KefB